MVEGKIYYSSEVGTRFCGYARILVKRKFGKIAFIKARMMGIELQLVLDKSRLPSIEEILKLPVGSLIYATGEKYITNSGEQSLLLSQVLPIAKCHQALPEKYHGLTLHKRYKRRFVDLITNRNSFILFSKISKINQAIREFLWQQDYLEFNTGILQEFFEKGLANPFVTECLANGKKYYLSLTSELKLKSLMVAGFEKLFEITQSFRNEGIDSIHLPEFTILEIYSLGTDHEEMMTEIEKMIRYTVQYLINTYPDLFSQQFEIIEEVLNKPFRKLTFRKACEEFIGLSFNDLSLEKMCKSYPDIFYPSMPPSTWTGKLVSKFIRPMLYTPTFLTEIPSGLSPFVKVLPHDPTISQRAYLYINGLDIADIYTDENNPEVVNKEMISQMEYGVQVNHGYLEVLKFGLPQSASIGMSMNRFYMLFLENLPNHIAETTLNPF